jgi:hypothetical protein
MSATFGGWREKPMRRSTRLYGPDELKVLEQIVDALVDQLSRGKRLDTAEKKRPPERVSKQVFKQSNADLLEVDAIRQRVLASFKNRAKHCDIESSFILEKERLS